MSVVLFKALELVPLALAQVLLEQGSQVELQERTLREQELLAA